MLDCCRDGGCWKSRISKLFDGSDKDNSLCINPIVADSGQIIPQCMDMIPADRVIQAIRDYLKDYNYYRDLL